MLRTNPGKVKNAKKGYSGFVPALPSVLVVLGDTSIPRAQSPPLPYNPSLPTSLKAGLTFPRGLRMADSQSGG